MGLQRKAALGALGFILLQIIAIFVIVYFIISNQFYQIEQEVVVDQTQRALNQIRIEAEHLDGIASDYARWNETYALIDNPTPDYFTDNFSPSFYKRFNINFIVLAKTNKEIVFADGNVPAALLSHLNFDEFLLPVDGQYRGQTGLVRHGDDLLVLAIHPILKSDETGPANGLVIFGRFFNESYIQKLSNTTKLPLAYLPEYSSTVPQDFVLAKQHISKDSPIYVKALDENTIAGYTNVADIAGDNAMVVKVSVDRKFYAHEKQIMWVDILGAVAANILIFSAYLGLLQKKILQPLIYISNALGNIDFNTNCLGRIRQVGSDEVKTLSQSANQMLSKIEFYKQNLEEEVLRYRSLIHQASDGVFIVDPATGIIQNANHQFWQMTRYEACTDLLIYDLLGEKRDAIEAAIQEVLQKGSFYLQTLGLHQKDGGWLDVELRCSLITYARHHVILVNMCDMTEYYSLQEQLRKDVTNASLLQRNFLPKNLKNDYITVECLFNPHNIVSGDLYDYHWNPYERKLTGFILDVCGHGVAAGFQASLLSNFLWTVVLRPDSLLQKLKWVNKKAVRYFPEDSFATVILFELDLKAAKFSYVTGGINYFLSSAVDSGKVAMASSLVGVDDRSHFVQCTIDTKPGDCFYLTSDGLYDIYDSCITAGLKQFDGIIEIMQAFSTSAACKDDVSALCIRINNLAAERRRIGMERLLKAVIHNYSEFEAALTDISSCLRKELRESSSSLFEIAVHEAINNALKHGTDKVGKTKVGLTIYRLKKEWLLVEVRDSGQGFDARGILEQMAQYGQEIFEKVLFSEQGRGIAIMHQAADGISYNKKGTRIRLAKKIVYMP